MSDQDKINQWLETNNVKEVPERETASSVKATGICSECHGKFIPMRIDGYRNDKKRGYVNKIFVGDRICYYCRKILIGKNK